MARTCLGWLQITVFYLMFYTCLVIFFELMWFVFAQTITLDRPKYIGNNGIIGSNPGVSFRPQQYTESSLIHFRTGEDGNYLSLVQKLDDFLQHLRDADYLMSHRECQPEEYQYNSDYGQSRSRDCQERNRNKGFVDGLKEVLQPFNGKYTEADQECQDYSDYDQSQNERKLCKIDTSRLFQSCNRENDFGYSEGRPCILIKLNRIYDWMPEPFEDEEQMEWYPNFPSAIKEDYQRNEMDGKGALNKRVWLHCEGANAADKENLGEITYYPDRGFHAQHFPFLNQPNYFSPVVFIQLNNPTRGVMITIECTAWANNIYHHYMHRRGLNRFEVMIDP